ncbi:hypothetical protein [uncultured Streptomyces sp.]|uniref:hypothetical protein n=1 Tax=uncultured Streptomyces sp. TaxID=174707 RepID=UPI00261AA411|nr:hypothetical protein [uncultured Streptomyces sp.]
MTDTTALPAATRESVTGLFAALARDQERARATLNLVPSENVLSPLARVPMVLDAYARYFFDHKRMFGAWSFFGGTGAGEIEQETLVPLLRDQADAPFVNPQPVSGLNCMTAAMSALASPGDTVVLIPTDAGGHMSTSGVARRLGLRVLTLPMADAHTVDREAFDVLLRTERPALVYLDQSTVLFPLDCAPLRAAIERESPGTLLHFDSSHLNGLILSKALPNPLDQGADTFGGSTHKTLAGPHKAFLATRREDLAGRIAASTADLVSHHHPAEVLSLAVTLLELRDRDGAGYGAAVLANARALAGRLHERGASVAAAERGFTGCHQVWLDTRSDDEGVSMADTLFEAGVAVNRVGVPGVRGAGFRLSSAEVTRCGATEADSVELADVIADVVVDGAPADRVEARAAALRARLYRPRYCFDGEALEDPAVPQWLRRLAAAVAHGVYGEDR